MNKDTNKEAYECTLKIPEAPFHKEEGAISVETHSESPLSLALKYLEEGDPDIFMKLAKTLDASSLKALLNMRMRYKAKENDIQN